MATRIDFFDKSYANFAEQLLVAIRQETFGEDIGQNSWVTAPEYEQFIRFLGLPPHAQVLEVASGAGGPAVHLAKRSGYFRCAALHRLDEPFPEPRALTE
jgi:hypothetical protein